MKVGKLLVLLGSATMGSVPGAIGAIQLGWEPRQELSSNWWLQCGGGPAPAPPAMWPAVDHEWESRSLDCTAQRDKETLRYALAVNPRHRLFKHGNGAAAPSNTAKSKPSREAKRQNRECGQPRPAPPQ